MSDNKLANPAALGLGGFAMTTFLLNFVNAGIVDANSLGMVLPVGLFYGGLHLWGYLLLVIWGLLARREEVRQKSLESGCDMGLSTMPLRAQ